MIHTVDEQLAAEIRRCSLVFTCERGVQLEPIPERGSSGYPNEDHRARSLSAGSRLVFCEEFELA